MSFTREQPKDGDTVMHCGHISEYPAHWFQYEEALKFTRPDGTRGEAEWFVACEPCFLKHGERAPDFVRGDGRWIGNEPTIRKEVEA
jgi:hypothetical protein